MVRERTHRTPAGYADERLAGEPVECPVCDSDDTSHYLSDLQGSFDVVCRHCGSTWVECWKSGAPVLYRRLTAVPIRSIEPRLRLRAGCR